MIEAIPEHVLGTLEAVRASGKTNMLDRQAVIILAACDEADDDTADWLEDNDKRYMEALIAMGERRQR